jgi:hypothetical protein
VIFLAARYAEDDLVRGLGSGGDDDVVKPPKQRELIARVNAALRRHAGESESGAARRPAASRTYTRSKPMTDPKKSAGDGGADRNVDQIRDILFRGQMRCRRCRWPSSTLRNRRPTPMLTRSRARRVARSRLPLPRTPNSR